MKSVAGVLCTRVRLEEKRLIAALGSLGVDVKPLPPSDAPLPIQPLSATAASGDLNGGDIQIVIDRLQDRDLAAVWLPYWRQPDCVVIDAGLATTLDRLGIARLMTEAGLPRPETIVILSETSGLQAISGFGGRGTLMPLRTGSGELPLHDSETAEAVLEHRSVLGNSPESLALIQRGVADAENRVEITVVDGAAVAREGGLAGDRSIAECGRIAENVARVLSARLIGVSIAEIDSELVVWDVTALPSFRNATPLGERSVEAAIAELTVSLIAEQKTANLLPSASLIREEQANHVLLSA